MADNYKKKLILALDDVVTTLHLIRKQLEDLYDIALAKDVEVALKIISGVQIDLILLDIEMPEMSGFDLMRRLQADPKTKDIPVIIVSSHAEEENVSQAAKLGAKGFIVKPVHAKILRGKIAALFAKMEQEQSS
jgi:CheY-like chemotaxis protein